MNIAFELFVQIISFCFSELAEFSKCLLQKSGKEDPFIFIQFIRSVGNHFRHSDGHFQVFEIRSVTGDFLQLFDIGFHQAVVDVDVTGIIQGFQIDVAVHFSAQDMIVEHFPEVEFLFFIPHGHLDVQVEGFTVERFDVDGNFFSLKNAFASPEAGHG